MAESGGMSVADYPKPPATAKTLRVTGNYREKWEPHAKTDFLDGINFFGSSFAGRVKRRFKKMYC